MMSPTLYLFGLFAISFLSANNAQRQTFQYSSFSQIPQSLLANLSPEQVSNLRQTLGGGSQTHNVARQLPPQQKKVIQLPAGYKLESNNGLDYYPDEVDSDVVSSEGYGNEPGSGPSNPNVLSVTSFDQVPKSILDSLTPEQKEQMRNAFSQGGVVKIPVPAANPSSGPSDPNVLSVTSFDQVPKSILDSLTPEQKEQMRNAFSQGGVVKIPVPAQPAANPSSGPSDPNVLSVTSFDQVPKSILDSLTPEQKEQMRNAFSQGGVVKIPVPAQPAANPKEGSFSSFDQIPQRVLDRLQPEQIQQMKDAFSKGGIVKIPIDDIDQPPQPVANPKEGSFSSFDQIPQRILDRLTPEQIQQMKDAFSKGGIVKIPIDQGSAPSNPKEHVYTSFSQIPQSLLDRLSPDQIQQMRDTFKSGGTVKIPVTDSEQPQQPSPEKIKENNLINIITNYVAAGGFLTGVPPIDLLLLRVYLNEGPKKFCH